MNAIYPARPIEANSRLSSQASLAAASSIPAPPGVATAAAKPKLLDQIRHVMRLRHRAHSTEECYADWIRRFWCELCWWAGARCPSWSPSTGYESGTWKLTHSASQNFDHGAAAPAALAVATSIPCAPIFA